MFNELDLRAVNTLRALSMNQIAAANSGHPGLPLGAAPMAYALWANHLEVNPKVSGWVNRDRFVLSAGHGSALLYSLLHVAGFDVTMEDLRQFRQQGSRTPGHPEVGHTDGVEATTGPLGQGFAQAVGMAAAEAHLASKYNREGYPVMNHYTYALCGDGDLMEGVSYEAASFAGRQALGKLIVLYDSNDISLDGDLAMAFNEDIQARFQAQGWHYLLVEDSNDLTAIDAAIAEAKKITDQPTLIEVKTVIGYGSPLAGSHKVHGSPLKADQWEATKQVYGWEEPDFVVPSDVQDRFDERIKYRGELAYRDWQTLWQAYQADYPELAAAFTADFQGELASDYDQELNYVEADSPADATRSSSAKAIQALASQVESLWGGSADLSSSNKSMIDGGGDFMPDYRQGRNIWYGVREFAMAAILNGILLHGGSKSFVSTFFVFTDYLKPAVRLAALSKIPAIYVMTHDSIAVGEDGPTHEPIEQLAGFRAMPNLDVIRPADVNETFAAWKLAVESTDRPTMLVLTRQNVPVLEHSAALAEDGVRRGAYVASPAEADIAEGLIIATGSEVALAVEAQAILRSKGHDVAVVSMPAMNRFEEQDASYQDSVLPPAVTRRMTLEMGASYGWHKYAGSAGLVYGIDRFGQSAPGDQALADYGFTADQVATAYLAHFN